MITFCFKKGNTMNNALIEDMLESSKERTEKIIATFVNGEIDKEDLELQTMSEVNYYNSLKEFNDYCNKMDDLVKKGDVSEVEASHFIDAKFAIMLEKQDAVHKFVEDKQISKFNRLYRELQGVIS